MRFILLTTDPVSKGKWCRHGLKISTILFGRMCSESVTQEIRVVKFFVSHSYFLFLFCRGELFSRMGWLNLLAKGVTGKNVGRSLSSLYL